MPGPELEPYEEEKQMKHPLRIVIVAALAVGTLLAFTASGGLAKPNRSRCGRSDRDRDATGADWRHQLLRHSRTSPARRSPSPRSTRRAASSDRPLKIISADTKSDLGLIAGVANSLLDQGADVMIPTLDYDFGGPSARAANARKIPAISLAGDSRFGLQGIGKYLFNQFPAGSEAAIGGDLGPEQGLAERVRARRPEHQLLEDLHGELQVLVGQAGRQDRR